MTSRTRPKPRKRQGEATRVGHEELETAGELSWALSGNTRLIGRDRELAQLQTVLNGRRPALVVIRGAPGIGKRTFLAEVADWLAAHGWSTARAARPDEPFAIGPMTTDEDFCARLRSMLREPVDSLRLKLQVPDGPTATPESTGAGRPLAPPSTAALAAPPLLEHVARVLAQGGSRPTRPCVDELNSRAPVLVIIDDYQPSPNFARWFEQGFLDDVRRCDGLILIAVADRGRGVESLQHLTDLVITLGRLDRTAVRSHLREVGQFVSPPLTSAELRDYARFACERPELLSSFTRLLQLVSPAASTLQTRP